MREPKIEPNQDPIEEWTYLGTTLLLLKMKAEALAGGDWSMSNSSSKEAQPKLAPTPHACHPLAFGRCRQPH